MKDQILKSSSRLKAVASFLPKGANFADIGSDHAYLPVYVCKLDKTAKAIAGEINKGPYESARNNVKEHALDTKVEVRLGDGLDIILPGEVEQIVIAGMGGSLIHSILASGKDKLTKVNRIIAQPNIDSRNTRLWLYKNNFILTAESILEENGHIYEILVADAVGECPYDDHLLEKQLFFGPYLMANKSDVFYKKWKKEKDKLQSVLKQMERAKNPDLNKIKQFEKELAWMEEELNSE